ncbi:MAG: T9SS type A sorting domain-containing protein, partial [Paludibacteraceae bacterium]|nr:T9SS type A sorting domain-containing protein [Paludibacteraceae bacterium]
GKVLVEKAVNADQAEIDLSSYNRGIYLVKVVTENDSYIEKVVLK